ncbi:FGGY-family carbohydrate kinase [Brevundimonas sp.]|uniref:FGGY-family carbohydrate kinase n=1 Tax=Brevundimonas sp. TaxID=1871086 RepID=UPI003B006421
MRPCSAVLCPSPDRRGDQQAAPGRPCALKPGDAKITYGTGAFLVANVGDQPVASTRRLLGTLGYQAGGTRGLCAGGLHLLGRVGDQWLRDGVGMISHRASRRRWRRSFRQRRVYLVPGFTGLGAPWWEPEARGTIVGLTRGFRPGSFRPARRWRPWPIRRATCWTPWPRTGPRR